MSPELTNIQLKKLLTSRPRLPFIGGWHGTSYEAFEDALKQGRLSGATVRVQEHPGIYEENDFFFFPNTDFLPAEGSLPTKIVDHLRTRTPKPQDAIMFANHFASMTAEIHGFAEILTTDPPTYTNQTFLKLCYDFLRNNLISQEEFINQIEINFRIRTNNKAVDRAMTRSWNRHGVLLALDPSVFYDPSLKYPKNSPDLIVNQPGLALTAVQRVYPLGHYERKKFRELKESLAA